MQINIDIASGPPSYSVIQGLRNDRRVLCEKISSLSTWAGVIALVSWASSYYYKHDWIMYVFVVTLLIFVGTYKYTKYMRETDAAALRDVPSDLCAQLFLYCQATPAATAYKDAVLSERRPFMMAEYHALQAHARAAGSDEGVGALYGNTFIERT